jgi:hypothetical protein
MLLETAPKDLRGKFFLRKITVGGKMTGNAQKPMAVALQFTCGKLPVRKIAVSIRDRDREREREQNPCQPQRLGTQNQRYLSHIRQSAPLFS